MNNVPNYKKNVLVIFFKVSNEYLWTHILLHNILSYKLYV